MHQLGVLACSSRLHLLLRPLRITVSKVAMKSVMTASALCRPARTEMMSELGFVYFLARAASRKMVKVWLVSQRSYRARARARHRTSSAKWSAGVLAC